MTQLIDRPTDQKSRHDGVPSHPHYTLGTMIVLGVLGTIVAVGLAIAALTITASRNSVDDALVSQKVDQFLDAAQVVGGYGPDNVVPELTPKAQLPLAPESEVNVSVAPNVPPPSGRTSQAIVEVHFEVVEGLSTINPATGLQTETWGYRLLDGPDGMVIGTPGPMIRARVGDLLRFTITNPAGNHDAHNVDFHAVTGTGGGAEATVVAPGETKTIEARLLYPGFFMYHCAYGDLVAHIAHGMYGGILVDPETPLPDVDHEWYVVQSEYFLNTAVDNVASFNRKAATDENPSHVVFNGAVGALTGDNALQMNVGERGRIYFINAGLNMISSFHPIGSHWDRVYPEAALLSSPIRGSQTTLIPAGGGTVVELVGYVPSTVVLVDHALARAVDKGAIGQIVIAGDPNPDIFEGEEGTGNGGHDMGGHQPDPVEGHEVSILPNSWEFQDMDSPDEFADNETPADYSVNVLRIKVGETVTWTNTDPGMLHTVTAVDGSFDSGFLNTGDTWSYTFDTPGEYEYFCAPHPWMRAKVIVEG